MMIHTVKVDQQDIVDDLAGSLMYDEEEEQQEAEWEHEVL